MEKEYKNIDVVYITESNSKEQELKELTTKVSEFREHLRGCVIDALRGTFTKNETTIGEEALFWLEYFDKHFDTKDKTIHE